MKNVAKCDTWCELQNPVNHRVFERKLRPRPLGRGHVCLGVTHSVAPRQPRCRGAEIGPPAPAGTVGTNVCPRRRASRSVVVVSLILQRHQDASSSLHVGTHRPQGAASRGIHLRPQVRRDHPLSLSISISGGKETYKDSPSNGERTGKSPAWESGGPVIRIVVWRSVLSGGPGPSPLEGGAREGESPVVPGPCRTTRRCRRVGLFGNAALSGR
jgi:hypothetical protein